MLERTHQFHIAVCDDEPLDREETIHLIKDVLEEETIPGQISAFSGGSELLGAIQGGAQFHTLFLDVMMEDLDGMALAAALRERGNHTAIVFVSSNRDMALRGYEVAAVRYLAKPLDPERLHEALMFCYESRFEQREILLPAAGGQSRILPSDIIFAEAWERGVRLTLRDGQADAGVKISDLAAMLPERQFVLCHRTVLVNLAFVQSIRYCELELKSGKILPISKYRQTETRQKLMRYLDG